MINPYKGYSSPVQDTLSNTRKVSLGPTLDNKGATAKVDLPTIPLGIVFPHYGTYRLTFLNDQEFDFRLTIATGLLASMWRFRVKSVEALYLDTPAIGTSPDIQIFW